MKQILFIALLSILGKIPSENRITYRPLAWSDFRAPVPAEEPNVGARSACEMEMETTDIEGRYTFVVRAYFLPDSSFVRFASIENLRHEQTHFKIACIQARRCQMGLVPMQHGDSLDKVNANYLFQRYFEQMDRRNAAFDSATRHNLDREQELIWENKISRECITLGIR